MLRKTATKIASESVEAPIELDDEAVRESLGRRKYYREVAERTAVPGRQRLAATATGGDVLFIEATSHKDGDSLVLTGQLGDVMKESAQIALSSVRALAPKLGIDEDLFEKRAFHLHVPAGAIRKDGPSAGITMATASPRSSPSVREAHRRDDGRDHASGPGAADQPQAEGSRRPRGRHHRHHHPGAHQRIRGHSGNVREETAFHPACPSIGAGARTEGARVQSSAAL